MFKEEKIKKLKKRLKELEEKVERLNRELGNSEPNVLYINGPPARMSEELSSIIKYLGIEFKWVKGKAGYYKAIKKRKLRKAK